MVTQLKHVLLDLHASWVMWLLLGLSVISLLITIERALFFRLIKDDLRALSEELDRLLRLGLYGEALAKLEQSPSPEAAIAVAGLKHADLGPTSAEKAMNGALALERIRLERGLTFLGTLGNNAPFVGLLGTVIGVIEAFEALGADGAAATAGTSSIMAGIAEALVATAIGLFVAIPAVAAFNFFQRKIQSITANSDALSNVLLAHLSAEELVTAPPPPSTTKGAH